MENIQLTLPLCLPETESSEARWNERLCHELAECLRICARAGIRTGPVRWIRVNPRLNCAWGRCICNLTEGTYAIEINRALMGPSVPELSLKKTILHELCHTVADGHGHKGGWRMAAMRLNQFYGLRLSRAATAEELMVQEIPKAGKARYVFRCCGCGAVVERSRRCPFVNHSERYRCGNCGGRFERI